MSPTDLIKKKGLRNTDARRQLLSFLGHARAWTAAQLHRRMKKTDLSTVYRNLRELERAGVVNAVIDRGGETYYELTGRKHHAHRLCDRCRAAECILCPVRLKGDHRLEIAGRCDECKTSS